MLLKVVLTESICRSLRLLLTEDSGFINVQWDDRVLAISLQSLLRCKDLQTSRVGKHQQWFPGKKIVVAACGPAVPFQDGEGWDDAGDLVLTSGLLPS